MRRGRWVTIGLLLMIYTSMFYPPPTLAVPNWPPYNGTWPLPASIVPTPAPAAQP